jgi:hypothetical protein
MHQVVVISSRTLLELIMMGIYDRDDDESYAVVKKNSPGEPNCQCRDWKTNEPYHHENLNLSQNSRESG